MKKCLSVFLVSAFCFLSCSSDDDDLTKMVRMPSTYSFIIQFYTGHVVPLDCEALDEFALELIRETQRRMPELEGAPDPYRNDKGIYLSERTFNEIFEEEFEENEAIQIAAALEDRFLTTLDACAASS